MIADTLGIDMAKVFMETKHQGADDFQALLNVEEELFGKQ